MSSTQFSFDVDDASFVLFDQLAVPEALGALERYADLDRDVYAATLAEGYRMARDVLAPLNRPGDRQGCRLDREGNVTTPDGYREAWERFRAGGWVGPRADPDLGGAGLPAVMGAVLNEMFSGACVGFNMYAGLTAAAARMVLKFAPEQWRRPVATKLFAGSWTGTMCLTESGAGSSVGDTRAVATPTETPGRWALEGEKIFITGGDCDLAENIVHLVLARTPGAPAGTKGLSLFLVPKRTFDDELRLGERNGAVVRGIEHKMGIHGSATCVLGLGGGRACHGWLMGGLHEGIGSMFHMMNEARIGVGVQGLAMGSAALQYSRAYARERVQGSAARELRNADAPRVAIVEHPDVRRMLLGQRAVVESMRAMCYRIARDFDLAEHGVDAAARERLAARIELMLPIVKAMCTDLGFEVAVTGLQIHGGYGYTAEFPIEQLVRDAKIQSIYEGTNGIQALDLLGRKLRIQGGRAFMEWVQDAGRATEEAAREGLEKPARALGEAARTVAGAAMALAERSTRRGPDAALQHAVSFLRAMGWVALGLESLDQARVAARTDTPRAAGKRCNLDFFVAQLLPLALAAVRAIESDDESCLQPEAV
jgi:hypothetical protein